LRRPSSIPDVKGRDDFIPASEDPIWELTLQIGPIAERDGFPQTILNYLSQPLSHIRALP
jgi:hypothetical protein